MPDGKIKQRNTLKNSHGINVEYYRELKKVYVANDGKIKSLKEQNETIKTRMDNIEKTIKEVQGFAIQLDLFNKEDYTLKPNEFKLLPEKRDETGDKQKQ